MSSTPQTTNRATVNHSVRTRPMMPVSAGSASGAGLGQARQGGMALTNRSTGTVPESFLAYDQSYCFWRWRSSR